MAKDYDYSGTATAALRERIADLELRLLVATDANVADRMRISALESALREAINWIADRSTPDSTLVARLRKVLG